MAGMAQLFRNCFLSMVNSEFEYESALRACSRGDKQALHGIYTRESRRMLGVALRIVRNRQIAEEVIHDAFISIWTKAGSFDGARGSALGWMYSIVRHQALNVVRDGRREVTVEEESLEPNDDDSSWHMADRMTDEFELRADLGRLHECLAHLDAAKRNSILFAYIDGCSHSEIAERLRAPLGTVKAWIKRGMGSLRECMA